MILILGRSKAKNQNKDRRYSKDSIFWNTFKGRRFNPFNGIDQRPFWNRTVSYVPAPFLIIPAR